MHFHLKMAARIDGIFDNASKEAINKSKLLVVGAGGIGCELLKTLVLTGFENIHVIDLDTIDLSNLNRQFLFHKQHIGKPKAIVAKESVLRFNPKANITAYHDSITNTKYTVQFYRQFTCVANALDNIAARSHVNRMCMAADIPLIESGSAGYKGQTTVYKRKVTECYECIQRKLPKSYPGCTIRNTPSEPVHCIVWAKSVFNQLFGELDAEDEVSPDVNDPDIINKENSITSQPRVSTRDWAMDVKYDPVKIFDKLFVDDINYLKSMSDLWKKRVAPRPLKFSTLPDAVSCSSQSEETEIADLNLWTMKQCGEVFKKSLTTLHKRMEEGGPGGLLIWDKDDDVCLDFVAACSNLRSYSFHIQQKSRFDIKAIAGNIIPAIATTNAIVAGLVVLQILKLLKGDLTKCRNSWINACYRNTSKLISCSQLEKPNPKCLVCSTEEPEIKIKLNVDELTLRTLDEKILKEKLLMIQPDVIVNDGSAKVLISSDPEDMTEEMLEKPLSDYDLVSDSRLLCEDFFQSFKIHLVLIHDNDLGSQEFIFESDIENIENLKQADEDTKNESTIAQPDTSNHEVYDLEPESDVPVSPTKKSKAEEAHVLEPPPKKVKAGE